MSTIISGSGLTTYGPGRIVTDGLILHTDPANSRSYTGTGTVTKDLAILNTTWDMTNLSTTSGENRKYNFPDDLTNRYLLTTNAFVLTSPTNILSFDYFCNLTVPRAVSASGLFNDIAQQNGTPYVWVSANNSHLFAQYLRVSGGWGSTSSNNFFVGYSNTFVHVGVVINYNTAVISFYRNGQFVEDVAVGSSIRFPNSNSQKYMGTYQANYVYNWVGQIGTGKVYNRGLTAAEFLQNFNALKVRFGVS
jgi:hypothetical protein